ncbi:hypothetical protein SHI21_17680 [Bacteriovorax sp. PP10]|uniref:Lipoprotein n=1 Tax=Bacteriovorax antarcticus TaxID=3088717 RepID=A0ABU5VYC2_9BACT|nr:hypothetical protein [Bacteriovorax sp. PP10]MEA9358068.1 hypothetical protein [Bacteriovorax sp. PP10]
MGNKNRVLNSVIQKSLTLAIVSGILASCVPNAGSNVRGRASANATTGSSNVAVTQGRVLKDNPIILSGNASLAITADLNKYLGTAVTITSNSFLQSNSNCSGLTYCFEVLDTREAVSPLQTTDGKWAFKTGTAEFLQVNTFYHMNKLFDQFFTNLGMSLAGAYDSLGAPVYDTAIPSGLRETDGTFKLNSQMLLAFSNCDVTNNAYYDQATESLCFGHTGANKELHWAHDSTIIYHETGHFMQRLQLNMRNTASLTKVQMSNNLYNEAGAIGEGLSDFFSYYVNGRTHWGEWAAGNLRGSRPMSEADALHAPGLAADEDSRLSYPQYITYDPNYPLEPVEDIHMSGMIISHYLVALTQDLESKCSISNAVAREYVMYILNETMAELGDLTSKGTENGAVTKVNMNALNSSLWFNTINSITYRSFTQTIAKNLLNTIGNAGLNRCNGSYYTRDNIESLLDSYGLLLFKTYNQHRNLTNGTTKVNTQVTTSNRKKSVLISKSNLILDPTTGASSAYVIDNRAQIAAGITQLQTSGIIGTLSTQTPSDLGFNNNNSKVSPGEVVAIALNLYNNSNSTMGGIEILANDWDHATSTTLVGGVPLGRPCKFDTFGLSTDTWPLDSEGGSSVQGCDAIGAAPWTAVATPGDFAPVCFVQYNDSTATKWISQREFKQKVAIDSNSCLDKTNDKDCFIRAIKGADKAQYSKINPKSTWGQTMADPTTGKAYSLDWGNVLLFEVSKSIPPGTVVDCRMRVRFTNCEDCFHDSANNNNDFKDVEYNGPKPYKIIHLQIPITD